MKPHFWDFVLGMFLDNVLVKLVGRYVNEFYNRNFLRSIISFKLNCIVPSFHLALLHLQHSFVGYFSPFFTKSPKTESWNFWNSEPFSLCLYTSFFPLAKVHRFVYLFVKEFPLLKEVFFSVSDRRMLTCRPLCTSVSLELKTSKAINFTIENIREN